MSKINNTINRLLSKNCVLAITLLLSVFTFISCSDSIFDSPQGNEVGDDFYLKINVGFAKSSTRLSVDNDFTGKFEHGDEIGVYLSLFDDEGSELDRRAYRKNVRVRFNKSNSDWKVVEGSSADNKDLKIDFKNIGKTHYAYAYYPYDKDHKPSNYEVSVPYDQSKITDPSALGKLMIYQSNSISFKPQLAELDFVNFTLYPVFSVLQITVDDKSANLEVSLKDAIVKANLSMTSNFSKNGKFFANPKPDVPTKKEVLFRRFENKNGTTFSAVLPQQVIPQIPGKSSPITIKKDGQEYTYKANRGIALQNGYFDEVSLKLHEDSKTATAENPLWVGEIYVPKGISTVNAFDNLYTTNFLSFVAVVRNQGNEALLLPLKVGLGAKRGMYRSADIAGRFEDFNFTDGYENYKEVAKKDPEFNLSFAYAYLDYYFNSGNIFYTTLEGTKWYIPSADELLEISKSVNNSEHKSLKEYLPNKVFDMALSSTQHKMIFPNEGPNAAYYYTLPAVSAHNNHLGFTQAYYSGNAPNTVIPIYRISLAK